MEFTVCQINARTESTSDITWAVEPCKVFWMSRIRLYPGRPTLLEPERARFVFLALHMLATQFWSLTAISQKQFKLIKKTVKTNRINNKVTGNDVETNSCKLNLLTFISNLKTGETLCSRLHKINRYDRAGIYICNKPPLQTPDCLLLLLFMFVSPTQKTDENQFHRQILKHTERPESKLRSRIVTISESGWFGNLCYCQRQELQSH